MKLNREQRRASKMKQTYIMANLVYGPMYPQFWLENQLKSLLDPSNLPALKDKYKLEYAILTDDETLLNISRHPNFMQLSAICEIHVIKMNWPADTDRFNSRYGLLVQMFHQMLEVCIAKHAETGQMPYLSCWVADLVFAKHSLPKMLRRLEDGHDAVFNVPIRSAADSVNPILAKLPGAPTDLELFEMAYRNLHHLWTHSHWDNPMFSRMPYSMLWNSGSGLIAHNFGITPIVFKPSLKLKDVKGVIDADVPSYFENPYWATDWTDAAVAGVEPLSNGHYPPFLHHKANTHWVAEWSRTGTMPVQAQNLEHPLYYPCKSIVNATELAAKALATAKEIKSLIVGEPISPMQDDKVQY